MNNLINTILISLAVGFCLIGFHQTFTNGFFENYWIFMLTIILLSIFQYRKKNQVKKEETKPVKNKKKNG